MRIGVVVGASCDLPDSYLESNGIRVLPAVLQLDGRTWLDERDPERTMTLYRRHIADRALAAHSTACSAAEISDIFLHELVSDYERILVISACAEFSDLFERATEASYAILQHYRERREMGRHDGGFALRVLDSCSVGAGEAVLVCHAMQLLREGRLGFEAIRRAVRHAAAQTVCLVVAADPWFLGHRGLDGERSAISRLDRVRAVVSDLKPVIELKAGRYRTVARPRGFNAACAAALKKVEDGIARGSGARAVALSFGGDPRVIREMPAYQSLEVRALGLGAELHLSVMSATMAVRLGPGAFSVAWLAAADADNGL